MFLHGITCLISSYNYNYKTVFLLLNYVHSMFSITILPVTDFYVTPYNKNVSLPPNIKANNIFMYNLRVYYNNITVVA